MKPKPRDGVTWDWSRALAEFVEKNMNEQDAADPYCPWCRGTGRVPTYAPGEYMGQQVVEELWGECDCTTDPDNWDAGVRRILAAAAQECVEEQQ